MLSRPRRLWDWIFVVLNVVQAIISLGLQSAVFSTIQVDLRPSGSEESSGRIAPALLTYLSLISIYQLILVYDTIDKRNTFQAIGLALNNVFVLVYVAVSLDQFRSSVLYLSALNAIDAATWRPLKILLLANICAIAVATILNAFVVWKLYDAYAWMIYSGLHAPFQIKIAYAAYEILMALLKFEFVFYTGFFAQVLVLTPQEVGSQALVLDILLPISVVLVIATPYCVRYESHIAMASITTLHVAFTGYLAYRCAIMYIPSTEPLYLPTRKLLTAYLAVSMLLGASTISALAVCWKNFNRGLKAHLLAPRLAFEKAIQHREKVLQPMAQGNPSTDDECLMTDLVAEFRVNKEKSTASKLLSLDPQATNPDPSRICCAAESHDSNQGVASASPTGQLIFRRQRSNTDAIESV